MAKRSLGKSIAVVALGAFLGMAVVACLAGILLLLTITVRREGERQAAIAKAASQPPKPPPYSAAESRYLVTAAARLSAGGDPAQIAAWPDPQLDPRTMRRGDVGCLPPFVIIQIPEPGLLLVRAEGELFQVRGLSTVDLVDGRLLELPDRVFEVIGPTRYVGIDGAVNTVNLVRLFNATRVREHVVKTMRETAEIRERDLLRVSEHRP